jgi:hypothetical protein
MERLKVKIAGASKALARLREVTGIDEVPAITRDAAIQRFEFTFEAIWKVAKMEIQRQLQIVPLVFLIKRLAFSFPRIYQTSTSVSINIRTGLCVDF